MNQFKLAADKIFIGPQLKVQDLVDAKQQGIKTVIDFRMPSETLTSNKILTQSHGLDYVNIPVNKADLSADLIRDLDAVMKDKEGSFLLHCATGTRAALMHALSQAKHHEWTAEQAFAEVKRIGFDLKASPEFSTFVVKTVN